MNLTTKLKVFIDSMERCGLKVLRAENRDAFLVYHDGVLVKEFSMLEVATGHLKVSADIDKPLELVQ